MGDRMETTVQVLAPTLAGNSSSSRLLQEAVVTIGDKALSMGIIKQMHQEAVEVILGSIIREIWADGKATIEHKGIEGRISDRHTLSSSEVKAAVQEATI